ncbi:MAG: hypothetical protein GY796_34405, partial [Chloroflexi bacterium]|nr:hypothetical protein [Chloroflexota bacterium]
EPWLSDMPPGSIILGVDPTSCDPSNWDGGAVTAEFFLPNTYTLTVMLLQLEWPDQESKGLHSPERNQTATITLDGRSIDGRSIWSQRTTHLRANGDYYATGHNTILTTFVLTQSITHTLSISVPAQTAWDLSEITLTAYPYPDKHRGVGYSPYWDCQSPETSFQPTEQAIREDLFRLFHTSTAMRTYAATGVNGLIPALANEIGLPIYAGAWLDGDEQADDLEIQALLTLANSTNLEGVIVGNEYYLRNRTETDLQYLLQKIEQVKAIVDPLGIPVTTAELDNLMFTWESGSAVVPTGINPTYRPILDEVDIVLVHIYPFWSGLPIDGAAAFTVNRYKAIQTLIEQEYPGQNKKVVIGEAGWPSLGSPPPWGNAAQPGFLHQEIYMLEFLKLAEQEAVEYFYFDAFDELWKIEEPGFVGQNWGYSYSDRAAKHYFYGVLLPEEKIPTPPRLEHKVYLPSIATTASQRFSVYTEWLAEHDGFLPTGATGDSEYVSVYECHPTQPHRGNMSIQASFSPGGPTGSGGVQWQYPADNWGDQEDGLDLSWANKLTFWARGNLGGEKARFFVGGIGDKDTPYPDSLRPVVSSGYMTLTDTWQQYTINLSGQDLSHVIGGFGWSTNQCANPAGATFYLDNIFFEYDP